MSSKNWNNKRSWKPNSQQQQQGRIGPGLCGLFFTAVDEKRAIREANNLIDQFMHVILEEEKPTTKEPEHPTTDEKCGGSGKELDISDELKATCQDLKQQRDNKWPRFYQLDTGTRCTLFFSSSAFSPENVYHLAERMVESCQGDQQTRFLAKVIPIEETCSASLDQMMPALTAMLTNHLTKYMKETIDGESETAKSPPSYAVDFKVRNTKAIDKQEVYDKVAELFKDQSPGSSVNLTKPDLHIVMHVIRTTAFLAVLRKFDQLRKYTLRKPEEQQQEGKKMGTQGQGNSKDEADVEDGQEKEEEEHQNEG